MREIAYMLHLNYGTVGFHIQQIREARDIRTSAKLIEYAIRQLS